VSDMREITHKKVVCPNCKSVVSDEYGLYKGGEMVRCVSCFK